MAKWRKTTMKLKENHGWTAKPGYKIFVANAGDIRFDIPDSWVISPGTNGSIKFNDRPSPDDRCAMELSVFRLRRDVDWSGLSIRKLFDDAVMKGSHRQTIWQSPVYAHQREGFELVWAEFEFLDPGEKRPARDRTAVAFGRFIHALLTLVYWPEDAAWVEPAWDEALRSMQVGVPIKDPTHRRLD